MSTRFITVRTRRAPLNAASLRLLQEIETLQHGYALGGEFRARRTVGRA